MGLISKINGLKMTIQNKSIETRNLRLWITKKTKNPSFMKDYLEKQGVQSVVLYGHSLYSDLVMEELNSVSISIVAMIAGDWSINSYGIPVYSTIEECMKNIKDDNAALLITNESKPDTDVKMISLFDILYDK